MSRVGPHNRQTRNYDWVGVYARKRAVSASVLVNSSSFTLWLSCSTLTRLKRINPGPYSEGRGRGLKSPRKVFTKIFGSTFLRNDHNSCYFIGFLVLKWSSLRKLIFMILLDLCWCHEHHSGNYIWSKTCSRMHKNALFQRRTCQNCFWLPRPHPHWTGEGDIPYITSQTTTDRQTQH